MTVEQGSSVPREEAKVNEHRLYTACWRDALNHGNDEVLLVRTSIGKPRWVPSRVTAELPFIKELMPYGLMGKDLPWPAFVAGYTKRLDEIGVTVLEDIFDDLRRKHGDRPLVLLCFEHDPRQCHRGVFARWWMEETGEVVPEWPSGDHSHVCEAAPAPEPVQEQLV